MVEKIKKLPLFFFLFVLLLFSTVYFSGKQWHGNEKWKWIIAMDGRGYYAYLPAIFIFSDPTYSFYEGSTPMTGDKANFTNKLPAGTVNKFYIGEALMLSPFFFAAHTVANIFSFSASGYSLPYYYGVLLASIFYYIAGIYFMWLLLRLMKFSKTISFISCLSFAIGTNLFYYTVYEPSMSHVYSFFSVSAFLYFIYSYFENPQNKTLLFSALFLGFIIIIRPVNGLIVTFIPFMSGNFTNLKTGIIFLFKKKLLLFSALLILLSLLLLQLLAYYWQTGNLIVWSYKNEGFNFNNPQIANSLFSYNKGLFIYTPVAFISMLGLFVFLIKKKYYFVFSIIPLAGIVYVISSWHAWSYGWSFGLRPYIEYYPFMAILLAFLLKFCFKNKWSAISLSIFLLAAVLLSLVQTYQINKRILHLGDMTKDRYWEVFLKTDSKYKNIYYENDQQNNNPHSAKFLISHYNDMEGTVKWKNTTTIKNGIAHSGNHSSLVNKENSSSVTFLASLTKIDSLKIDKVRVGLWINAASIEVEPELIISLEDSIASYSYNTFSLKSMCSPGKWMFFETTCPIKNKLGSKNIIKIFVINKVENVYVDDFKIDFIKKL